MKRERNVIFKMAQHGNHPTPFKTGVAKHKFAVMHLMVRRVVPLHAKGLEIWQMQTFKLWFLMVSFC